MIDLTTTPPTRRDDGGALNVERPPDLVARFGCDHEDLIHHMSDEWFAAVFDAATADGKSVVRQSVDTRIGVPFVPVSLPPCGTLSRDAAYVLANADVDPEDMSEGELHWWMHEAGLRAWLEPVARAVAPAGVLDADQAGRDVIYSGRRVESCDQVIKILTAKADSDALVDA